MSNQSECAAEIVSNHGKLRIEVVKRGDGNYSLRSFVKKFDLEEEVHYEVECLPSPSGIFANVSLATAEAKRLIDL